MDHSGASETFCSGIDARLARFPAEIYSESDPLLLGKPDAFRIVLPLALRGAAGLWSPSCIASAQLAVEELNARSGIKGRQVELVMLDAAEEANVPAELILEGLLDAHLVDSIVGMHISSVRERLRGAVHGRVPYIYTPLYEGGESVPGLFAIGETPQRYMGPAIDYLHDTYRIKRWALIGNDYVWPRVSHIFAKSRIKSLGGEVVHESYLPFGSRSISRALQELERSGAQAVLLSMAGQDAVMFNRQFGRMELHDAMVRLACGVEENALMASGAAGLKRLYSPLSYFSSVRTEANAAFREKYHALHGDTAPQLNAMGQSMYEGVHFLASLMHAHGEDWNRLDSWSAQALPYVSARRSQARKSPDTAPPIYLGRADGMHFEVVKSW